jgi:hypothetical protein
MTLKQRLQLFLGWFIPEETIEEEPIEVVEESKPAQPTPQPLDTDLYNFALKMQNVIQNKEVASGDYTIRDLEKIDDDIAIINAQYLEQNEFTGDYDVKVAARLFLLNNTLSN